MPLRGSCLCGAVTYEIDRLDNPIGHCHCRTCRKAHAAAFNTSAGVLKMHFRWLSGQEHLSAFRSSPDKARKFCGRCGTHLVAERDGNPHIVLRVATLDEDPGQRPAYHIWTAHEVPWLCAAEDAPRYETWQPGRS